MQAASLLKTLEPHLTPATPRTHKLALRGGFGVAVTVHAPAAPATSSASQRAGAESGGNSVPAEPEAATQLLT